MYCKDRNCSVFRKSKAGCICSSASRRALVCVYRYFLASDLRADTFHGQVAINKFLLAFQEQNCRSALHQAVVARNLPCLKYLLSSGADLSIVDSAGDTPLALAACMGLWSFVETIYDSVASEKVHNLLQVKNKQGLTALHYAMLSQYAGTVMPGGDAAANAASAWLEKAALVVSSGSGSEDLLMKIEEDLSRTGSQDSALLSKFRGSPSAVLLGSDSLIFFRELASVRAACLCPAGSKGYYELEILRECGATQFGFCNDQWSEIDDYSPNGVGGDGDSWGVDGIMLMR